MPEHFVLDTGPLIEFLVRTYEQETNQTWLRGVQIYSLRSQVQRALFQEFLKGNVGRLVVPSGVVAELEGRVRANAVLCENQELRDVFRAKFWALIRRTFDEYRIREEPVRLTDLDQSLVVRFGPVDASIVRLAQMAITGAPRVVVARDGPLTGLSRKRQVPFRSLENILEEVSGRTSSS